MFPLFIKPAGLGLTTALGGDFTFSSEVVAPLGRGGLTQIVSTPQDDDNFLLPDIGFPFRFYELDYQTNIYIGSNSYVTFGFGSNAYNPLSPINPGRGLLVNARDRSWRAIYAGSDALDTFRVRWEGRDASSTSGMATEFWEVTFYRDGALMLVTDTTGLFDAGVNTVTKGDGISYTNYSYNARSSFVFRPDGSGGYTVDVGSYG